MRQKSIIIKKQWNLNFLRSNEKFIGAGDYDFYVLKLDAGGNKV